MNILQRTAGRLAQDTVCLGLKVWRAPVEGVDGFAPPCISLIV